MTPDSEEDLLIDEVVPTTAVEPKRRKRSKTVKKIERYFSLTTSIILKSSILAAIAIAFIFIVSELFDSRYAIQKMNVPAQLSESGYSGEVIATRVADRLTEILRQERFLEDAEQYSKAFTEKDVDVDIAGAGVPVRAVVDMIGTSLGLSRKKIIHGDLTFDGELAYFVFRVADNPPETFTYPMKGSFESLVARISQDASESILKFSSPFILARHYVYGNSEGNFRLAKYLSTKHKDDENLQRVAYYANVGAYVTMGSYREAEALALKALERYPNDINLNAALTSILEHQGKHRPALAQAKKTLGITTKNNSRLRQTLSRHNLALAYYSLGHYDSAMYFFEEALTIDEYPLIYYQRGLMKLRLKSDTTGFLNDLELALLNGVQQKYVLNDSTMPRFDAVNRLLKDFD